ncbi:helix-turn-helix transcriptional regulator [Nocardioides sp. Soil805]|uniref:helix-turn-helix transcriptional regulator n=1 Tax=Nocardioides sp. Soil805 TaxID=1736416 RepID=UPI0007026205|nr:WYL domain-containing protein [Nocardioides sp. Soil805]KRF32340.1 transcriptional regulator [Nocardioides sp. Soil805]
MASDKAERLLNLYIMLLAQTRFVSKQDIRRAHYADYPDTERGDEAFEKAFERDKDDLRELGVVIEVGSLDAFFDDEPGYRISTDTSALPEIRFEADEAAVLGIAARAWEQATLARRTTEAMRKLTAQGVEVDSARLDLVPPSLRAEEPAFDAFWDATQKRRVVTFDYKRPGEQPRKRRLQPWGVVRSSGRWYVVGHDVDRDAERVFRLSRVQGRVSGVGKAGAYDVPPGTDVSAIAANLAPRTPDVEATVLVRQRAGVGLRRRASRVEEDVAGPDEESGWDRLVITGPGSDLAGEVLTYGASVVVEAPEELRADVLARLQAILEQEGVTR